MTEFAARVLADYKPSEFTIESTHLTFELDETNTVVTNVMSISKTKPIDQQQKDHAKLYLHGEQLRLKALLLNGKVLEQSAYQVDQQSLTVNTELSAFTLTIITEINPIDNSSLEGLFKSGGAFCTQCEAEGFRRISYYLDRPDVMATFTTTVIADKVNYPYLLSNGNKVEQGDIENGKHFVTWHDPFPKPCYLFAVVAGDFDLLTDSFTTSEGKDVALEIFVDRGNLNKAHHAMSSLKKAMLWDEQTFGLAYDLDIYMIVAVDFFNMGAMENKGLNVFNSKFVLADQRSATDADYFNIEAVIAHEYFHNWTGNRVTCRDWFQLSLKEGLTVFRDQQFSADMHSAAVTRIKNVEVLRSLQFAEDAGPMSHPIRPEKVVEMNNFYTLTVYEKGAEVIRMLNTLLGKDKFRKGIDLYFERFDGMAVTCDDFIDAMSDAAQIDLTQFKRWYSQSGTPELIVSESFDQNNNEFTLTIKQVNKVTELQKQKFDLHIPIRLELCEKNQSQQQLLQLTQSEQTWTFKGIKQKPVVALLCDFSAPVKLVHQQTVVELEQLMVSATDEFNRWDAGQRLLTQYIKELIKDEKYQLPASLITAFRQVLISDSDKALIAEQLSLPSFDDLVNKFPQSDPVSLVNALAALKEFIAIGLVNELTTTYQSFVGKAYDNNGRGIAERALKNICLSYLTVIPANQSLISSHYQTSDNMTDTLAALHCASRQAIANVDQLMTDFEAKWQDTALVMDKWFIAQASYQGDDIFNRLTRLEQHPAFSLKNPNRARSLVGAFAQGNPKHFHCLSGKGYRFLAKNIALLNDINPQVASRLITPLIQFERYDLERQRLIKAELHYLSSLDNLSRDLKEKLDAALIMSD
jgi:aminopeptidase N